jgi:rhodanese-related sulfurtransferase
MPRPGAAASPAPPQVPGIDVVEARRRLQGERPPYVLDVREPWEYLAGHLPGAVLVPLGELDRRAAEVPRDRPVLAVCHSGVRSWTAAAFLLASGYADVTNVDGGTAAWIEKGYPTER